MRSGTSSAALDFAAIGLGGGLGACLRFAVSSRMPSRMSTIGINVIGSFVLGALAASSPMPRRMKLGLGVGLCGGFTTFSTFAVELGAMVEAGEIAAAAGYFSMNNAGSVGAAVLGAQLARKAATRGR